MDTNDGKFDAKTNGGYFADEGVGITEESFEVAEEVKPDIKAPSKTMLAEVFFGLIYVLFGYVFGLAVLPFGAQPLGIAFLCGSNKKTGFIYIGLCLSAIGSDHIVICLCAYTAALFIRMLTRLTLDIPKKENGETVSNFADALPEFFNEHISLRMSTACVAVFIIGIYKLASGGFLYYDLYGAILSLFAAPAAVILISGQYGFTKKNSYFGDFSFALLATGLVYFSQSLIFAGISLSAFGAMFVTLYVCSRRGVLGGVLIGALVGLAYSPMLVPVFVLAALVYWILSGVSVFFAAIAAFTVGIGWGFYASGISALTGLLPAILAACVLFAVIQKMFLTETEVGSKPAVASDEESVPAVKKQEKAKTCKSLDARELYAIRLDDMNSVVKNTCDTLNNLSVMFFDICEQMKTPGTGDLRQICRTAFDASCDDCEIRTDCREGAEADTEAELNRISTALYTQGKVSLTNVSEGLRGKCENICEIIEEINYHSSLHLQQMMQSDKTEIFALEYAAMADLLAQNMAIDESGYEENTALTEKICDAMQKSGFAIDGAICYGTRDKYVILRSKETSEIYRNRERIIEELTRICPFGIEFSEIKEGEHNTDLIVKSVPKIKFEITRRSVCADGESDYCGDTTCVFENKNGLFYSFLSDGMGSGPDAAFASGISAMFLEKMLSAGNKCESALKMLNGFLRNKGSGSMHECSATVDLMELDLLASKVAFYKSGAAPTYILRDGSLFKLRSKTVPLGIIKELDAKKICFDVSCGDVVIMVSDGVTEGKDECPWLFDLIKNNIEKGIEHTADLIVKTAKNEGCTDDISVIIVDIKDVT